MDDMKAHRTIDPMSRPYVPVQAVRDRLLARYLRTQRHNMERFFRERGLLDSAERMRQIRLSRQGMMAKNQMFQEVLDDYAKQVTVSGGRPLEATGTTPQPESETAHLEGSRGQDVAVPNPTSDGPTTEVRLDDDDGARAFACGGVSELAEEDDNGIVIEE